MGANTSESGHVEEVRAVQRFYDDLAFLYDRKRFSALRDIVASDLELEDLKEFLSRRRVNLVADVGAGTGRIAQALEEVATRVVSVDVSIEMLKILRSRSLSGPALQGNVLALPFKDDTFDATTSYRVLWHLPSFSTALGEVVRVTKPGGVVIFDAPSPYSLSTVWRRIRSRREEVPTFAPSREEVNAFLEKWGMRIIAIKGSRSVLVQFLPPIESPSKEWRRTLLQAERRLQRVRFLRQLSSLHVFFAAKVQFDKSTSHLVQ